MTTPLVISDCDHAPSENPRYPDTCRKCGLPMPSPPESTRDAVFEDEMLELGIEGARRMYHHDATHFKHEVQNKMARGEERHQGTYPEKDCVAEAMAEPLDAAGWTLLDLDKLKRSLSEQQLQQLKMSGVHVMAAAALLYATLEQYRVARDEVVGQ